MPNSWADLPGLSLTPLGPLRPRSAQDLAAGRFSIGVETLDRGMWQFDRALPQLGPLGVKWARVQTGWAKCETQPGQYDFAWLDAIVAPLLAAGIQPWFNVGYGNRLYLPDAPHATAVGWTPVREPAARTAWAAFGEALARHFDGRVTWFEVWNEPDIKAFWTPYEPSAEDYADLVVLTAAALRSGQPGAKVVGGATAMALSPAGLEFAERSLAAGMAEVIDAYSYHLYAATPEPRYARALPALRALVDRYRPGLPLWQGESGAPSKGVAGQALAQYEWNETRQAKWNARRTLLDLAAGSALIAFFHAADFEFYIVKDQLVPQQYYFGLLRGPDYTPKPAWFAAQSLCALLTDPLRPAPEVLLSVAAPAVAAAETCSHAFATATGTVVAWWQGHDTQQEFTPTGATLTAWTPSDLNFRDPVLVDPLSQQVYALPATPAAHGQTSWQVPLVDWPLLLVERAAALA
ncbi:MAG: beta-galactosidase [Fimbriimonadaceae bacterium]|nr:beta-galactosidase [Fimbriimonadaceae bacterium]